MRFNKRWLLIIPVIVLLLATGFMVVVASTPAAEVMPEALDALESDAEVTVTADRWYIFTPAEGDVETGFIFYPGGYVPAEAYAPTAKDLAAEGYLVVIVPMPLNLAVLAPGRAGEVIEAYPEVKTWAVGGHSLGGAMAANFVKTHAGMVDGLVLWAAYPQASDDLSDDETLLATSIYATRDGLATLDEIEDSRQYLPEDTDFVEIVGGNHANFGWYGEQESDLSAEITREEQQAQVYDATLALLDLLEAQ